VKWGVSVSKYAIAAIIDEDVRRCLMGKFPYGILYTVEEDYILILAIMHCSQEPGYWKNRLEQIPPEV